MHISEEYIQAGLHRASCPTWLKPRELDVLMCIVPGPLGLGMSYAQAAKLLNISKKTVTRTTQRLRMRFPSAWNVVQGMRRCMTRQARTIRSEATGRICSRLLAEKHYRQWSSDDMRLGVDVNYTGPNQLPNEDNR
jgi:DNA-binding CsgD family transcriptional regulator